MSPILGPTLILATWAFWAVAGQATNEEDPGDQVNAIYQKVTDLWNKLYLVKPLTADGSDEDPVHAACEVKPSSTLEADQPQVTGQVLFRQRYPDGRLEAIFDLDGFLTVGNGTSRAIHVHKFGDLSRGCDGASAHYNPSAKPHPQHPGDFGNFLPREGKIKRYRTNLLASLFGPYSILGRSVVVHEREDDLGRGGNKGSQEHGNAGKRLACCVIGICGRELWDKKALEINERRKKRRESECKMA
ncbi:extracellular superoxide dismutase [Cu-Zn] isoform X2 [Tachyglossus aculeatus]|nr:extracellular superoxide dismutase [Cu-Zn] isoform X2 [Tachyglossus aculeatus]